MRNWQTGVLYVDLDRIKHTREFDALVPRLAEAKGIVFDLRGYPAFMFTPVIAHLIDETVTSAQWHVPLVHHPDRRGVQFQFSNWTVRPQKPRFTKNVAFVTDGRAISAAETFLGIIEHYKAGGDRRRTHGRHQRQCQPVHAARRLPHHLDGNARPEARRLSAPRCGHSTPRYPCRGPIAGIAEGRDELLERAVAVVVGQ